MPELPDGWSDQSCEMCQLLIPQRPAHLAIERVGIPRRTEATRRRSTICVIAGRAHSRRSRRSDVIIFQCIYHIYEHIKRSGNIYVSGTRRTISRYKFPSRRHCRRRGWRCRDHSSCCSTLLLCRPASLDESARGCWHHWREEPLQHKQPWVSGTRRTSCGARRHDICACQTDGL
jgi:hypothetical protein